MCINFIYPPTPKIPIIFNYFKLPRFYPDTVPHVCATDIMPQSLREVSSAFTKG